MDALALNAGIPSVKVNGFGNTAFDPKTWSFGSSDASNAQGSKVIEFAQPSDATRRLIDTGMERSRGSLKERGLIPVEVLLERAGMHLVEKLSSKLEEKAYEHANREAPTINPSVPTASHVSLMDHDSNTWQSSDEALTAFPPLSECSWNDYEDQDVAPTAASVGMVNPDGNARTRIEKVHRGRLTRYITDKVSHDIANGASMALAYAKVQEYASEGGAMIEAGKSVAAFTVNEMLCERCKTLGLTPELFLPWGPVPEGLQREGGWGLISFPFKELEHNSSCELCRLII
jgi:hypothetical protein